MAADFEAGAGCSALQDPAIIGALFECVTAGLQVAPGAAAEPAGLQLAAAAMDALGEVLLKCRCAARGWQGLLPQLLQCMAVSAGAGASGSGRSVAGCLFRAARAGGHPGRTRPRR